MKKNRHICMVGSAFTVRGGMTSVCKQLTGHTYGHGIEIHYVPTHEFGPKLHRCGVFVLGYLRLWKLFLSGKADLVHMHMSERGSFHRKYLVHRLAKLFGKPDVLHMHGSDFREFYEKSGKHQKARIRRLLRECDRVVVLGENWNRFVHSIEPNANTLVMNNAVAIPDLTAQWDEAETHLCYLGVLIPRKGVSDLLHAMRLLLDRPELPRPIRLTIAGSGAEEDALMALCRELDLSNYVTFLGWTRGEEKQSLLLSSQCFILPSYNEGLPVAILEAISCGLPVVTTDVGSTNEAITDNVDGRFVPVHDPAALADAIADVISGRERWETLRRGARDKALARFDENFCLPRWKRCTAPCWGRKANERSGYQRHRPLLQCGPLAAAVRPKPHRRKGLCGNPAGG